MNAEIVVDWYFAVHKSPAGNVWVGIAKKEPFVDGRPLHEPGEIWFEFGDTIEDALAAIKRSVLH